MVEDSPVLTADMIAVLRCSVCGAPLRPGNGLAAQVTALACDNGHTFDVARQGYVHLGAGRRLPGGDTAAMVAARERIMRAGLFAPLAAKLAQNVPTSARLVVDLGGGAGHYLDRALDCCPRAQGMVFDVSKPALKRAPPRLGAVLADTWGGLPLADHSVDVILNVFAPRNGAEMRRVLKDRLIVATPLSSHLIELRQRFGLLQVDSSKPERLRQTLGGFEPLAADRLEWTMELTGEQVTDLIRMGPNAFHHDTVGRPMTVTAAIEVTTWTGRPLPSRRADRDSAR